MARKPKPTLLKLVQGTNQKCRANPNEPMPAGNLSTAPDWFTDSQKEGWDFAIKHSPAGLLKLLDQSVLTIWVVAEDLHREASKRLAIDGLLTTTPNGMQIQSPYLPIMNRQAVLMMKAASELGFNPTARSKIVIPPEPRENSPWAQFIKP